MIGVDTNVLARLFVVDDRRQSDIAGQFFTGRSTADPAFVCLVVVAELVWLLDDSYDFSQTEIVGVLACLVGFLGDMDLAEEAAQEAFAIAAERWPRDRRGAAEPQSTRLGS